jgi:acyl-CoA thioester hydrolase
MKPAFRRETVRLVVPFHDCDPMGIVWHGNYLKYFEHARTALFRRCQLDVAEVRDLGLRMYVADARVRFTHPLGYGDEIEVSAKTTATAPLLRVVYSVRNLTRERRSARGNTVLAITDAGGELLKETPPEIAERLRA